MQRWSLTYFCVDEHKVFYRYRRDTSPAQSHFSEDHSSHSPQEELHLSFDSSAPWKKEEVYKKFPLLKQEKYSL